jgi:hypothetical protein
MIAGGAFLASTGSGPAAGRIPPSTSPVTTVPIVSESDNGGTGSLVEGSLIGLSFLFPTQLPEGLELKSVSVSPIGCCPRSFGSLDALDVFLATYGTADGKQMLAVTSFRVVGRSTPSTTARRVEKNAVVHGFTGHLDRLGSARWLTWDEDGATFNIYAPVELTEAQLTAFAEAIVLDKTTAAFTSSPPAGYAARYEGEGIVPAAWSTTLNFERAGAQVSVVIQQLSEAARATNEVREMFGSPGYKRVKINEANALVFVSGETVALSWNIAADVGVELQTDGLSEESSLALARSLQPVDEATFRATVGSKLSVESGSELSLANGQSVEVSTTTK